MVLNMPRILYAAARDNIIPSKSIASIHPLFKTPHVAIIIYSFLGFIFASIGEFRQLAMLSSASYLIIYLGVALSVIKLKYSDNSMGGRRRIVRIFLLPVITSAGIIWVLTNLPKNELAGMAIFIGILSTVWIIISIARKHNY